MTIHTAEELADAADARAEGDRRSQDRASMIVYDDERDLVRPATIDRLEAVPGANRIELAHVGGWGVVVRKGEFFEGQDVAFFEIDTCIPIDWEGMEHLADRGTFTEDGREYHRLKTVRLRGVYSQGLIAPWGGDLADEYEAWAGEGPPGTFASWLGIGKWGAPVKGESGSGKSVPSNAVGPFPTHLIQKTDSERAQNLGRIWDQLRERAWVVTEKIDGTSCTAYRDEGGELHVCSRNWELEEGDNLYWRVTKSSGIADALLLGDKVQFEIAGPSIQGNPLNLPEVRPFIFNVEYGSHRGDGREKLRDLWVELQVPVRGAYVPGSLPDRDELIAAHDGIKSFVNEERLAEGVVLRTASGKPIAQLGRNTFKVISNKYLLKERA